MMKYMKQLNQQTKCVCVIPNFFWKLCNDVLGIVQSAKYLGVTISDDLSWTPHISSIVTKAHQRLGFIRRNLRGSPYAYRAIAYKSLVRSQLEYCCTIWDTDKKSDINSIERVQRKSARWAKARACTESAVSLSC